MRLASVIDVQGTIDLVPPVSLALVGALAVVLLVLLVLARWFVGPPTSLARRWGLLIVRALVVAILLAILANPVRLDELPGLVERPKVVYLLDASQSMALGDDTSRWDEALGTIRTANGLVPRESQPQLSMFRFGRRLSVVEASDLFDPPSAKDAHRQGPGTDSRTVPSPTDPDTQLLAALRQLPARFGQSSPRLLVLFSDGQARDPAGLDEIARRYALMNVPIHVMPLGAPDQAGDVAIVNMVVPARVRKQSEVSAQVFVRSYGYDAVRTELRLAAVDEGGNVERQLNRLPITLRSGLQSFRLSFRSEMQALRVQASIPPQPNEVSQDNNTSTSSVAIDRTKIRVLYVDGAMERSLRSAQVATIDGPPVYSYLGRALQEDPDIECSELPAVPFQVQGAFPESRAMLFAYDVIVLSSAARKSFSRQQEAWIEEWVRDRGAGLCMVGGPDGLAAGGWRGSPLENMLPVTIQPNGDDWTAAERIVVRPVASRPPHPIWSIVADQQQNLAILDALPGFRGTNRVLGAKTSSTVLATTESIRSQDGPMPVIAVGPYGRGRVMAMTTSISTRWSPEFVQGWGKADNRYYAKFWRNAVYWLTENSASGRRRLIATTDKTSYQPGETIKLQAAAYDEAANLTTNCRVAVIIEPQSSAAALDSDYAPVRWPDGLQRSSGGQSPCVAWGEEFEMRKQSDEERYKIELPITEELAGDSAAHALRIELSAYEDSALVDSASIDVQILDDPFERRNPLPNPELLSRIAALSGGKVLPEAESLAAVIKNLSSKAGPPVIRKVPLWSRWWLLVPLLFLLTIEWVWRRSLGLA